MSGNSLINRPSKTIVVFSRVFRVLVLIIMTGFLLTRPESAAYAASNAVLQSCTLTSGTQFTVTASINDPSSVPGNKVYLFSVPMYRSSPENGAHPIASAKKKKSVSFSVRFKSRKLQDILNQKYVLCAKKQSGGFKLISNSLFITNASAAAGYKDAYPDVDSKKGLQVKGEMQEDAEELNIHHSIVNIVLSEMLAYPSQQNNAEAISYRFGGETYWFRRSEVESFDRQIKNLSSNGVIINGILLLGYRSDCLNLICPGGRKPGHSFYAWNVRDAQARKTFQAMLTFLAERYSGKDPSHGRIVGWIVGNEVNNYRSWNYAGEHSLKEYASIYANAFRLTYNAVTSVYANARVYISLDHLWNTKLPDYYTAHQMLDAFAEALKRYGNIPWNLAYHPYSSPLTEPRFWENKNRQVTSSITSPVINMMNLTVLTDYIREKYGSGTRIILSEQGYTSRTGTRKTQKDQAAAIAYSYYLTEANDMVDAFIMNRHVDHADEISQGLNLGLWTTRGTESADQKKKSWNIYKYIDTNLSEKVSSAALKLIGVKSWADLIDGFSRALYSKTIIRKGKLQTIQGYSGGKRISGKWKAYGASGSLRKDKKAYYLTRQTGANRNRLWGIACKFRKKLNLSAREELFLTLRVDGATSGRVLLKIRIFSGSKNIYECEGKIPAGREVRLHTSLRGWDRNNKITKIQIMTVPAGGSWSNASMVIYDIRSKRA